MFNFDFKVGTVASEGIYPEVVKFILWKLTHTETGESISGHTDLPSPHASGNFIAFNNLTKEIIKEWVYKNHDMATVESILLEKINFNNSSKIDLREIN